MTDFRTRYRLAPIPLGRGGQAEVFRAENRLTGEVVALKRRTSSLAPAVDRMRREIDVQSQLHHQHVMPILDFDEKDHSSFTMPLAVESLGARVVPLAVDELKRILGGRRTRLSLRRDAGVGVAANDALFRFEVAAANQTDDGVVRQGPGQAPDAAEVRYRKMTNAHRSLVAALGQGNYGATKPAHQEGHRSVGGARRKSGLWQHRPCRSAA